MFLHHLVEMGGFVLNHHWHGINILSILECALLAAVLCSLLALFALRKSKRLAIFSLAGALSFATAAYAANTALSNLSASGALAGANLIYVVQTVGSGGVKATMTQVATFINSLFSGDATVSSGGALTLATVNSNVGSFGSATSCITFTVNAKGLTTAASAATCTPAITAVTGLGSGVGTALAIAPGTTGSFPTQDGSIVTGNCLKWGPGIQDAGAACGSGGGAVASVTGGIGVTCSPTTGSVVCSTPATRRDNTATTDTITSSDNGTIVTENNASAVAVSITISGLVSTNYFTVKNKGAGLATYTPTSGNIGGAATISCAQGQSTDLYFDGTNLWPLANTCQLGALATVSPGSNVATAAANALSSAGGLTSTIASGTATLGTSAIASGACATVVTVSAPNVATTDVVSAGYNSDPTGVTGYGASATGAVLTIYPYPTSGNFNVKVCNSTLGSITPGPMTLNLRATR